MKDFNDLRQVLDKSFWKAIKNLKKLNLTNTLPDKNQFINDLQIKLNLKSYSPGIPELELISNKGEGIVRRMPVFSIEDYAVYYYCIKRLENILVANRVEGTFGGWTISGPAINKEDEETSDSEHDYGRYSFNPNAWKNEIGNFNSLVYSRLEATWCTHVISLDLSNFYDSINLEILERKLRADTTGDLEKVVTLLIYFLKNCNRVGFGYSPITVGIPTEILSDCSRLLANYYLQSFDSYAKATAGQYNMEYFRYADDMLLFALEPESYEKVLYKLSMKLSDLGLKINQKKVSVKTLQDFLFWKGKLLQDSILQENNYDFQDNFEILVDNLQDKEFRAKRWKQGSPILKTAITKSFYLSNKNVLTKLFSICMEKEILIQLSAPYLHKVFIIGQKIGLQDQLLEKISDISESIIHNSVLFEYQEFFSNAAPARVQRIRELIIQSHELYK